MAAAHNQETTTAVRFIFSATRNSKCDQLYVNAIAFLRNCNRLELDECYSAKGKGRHHR